MISFTSVWGEDYSNPVEGICRVGTHDSKQGDLQNKPRLHHDTETDRDKGEY